jgi:hypothetical protein
VFLSRKNKLCLKRVILEKQLFVCHNCDSKTFVIEDAFWPSKSTPRTLWVQVNCAESECGAGGSVNLSVADAKRCGFGDPDIG